MAHIRRSGIQLFVAISLATIAWCQTTTKPASQGNPNAQILVSQTHSEARIHASQRTRGVRADNPLPPSTTGPKYYALLIGNNDYQYLPKLQTAVHDATDVAALLRDSYGFVEPKVLLNGTHDAIATQLNVLRRTLPGNSNLVIYYAGHGYHDPDTDKAYWLPVDAEKDNNEHWISADDITSDIRAIPSQHVLIISDSCYSGALTRTAPITFNASDNVAYLKKMMASPSRTLMASGGDEPVADSGSAGHSRFAYVLLESLRRMDQDTFTAGDLFQSFIQPWVSGVSDQVPQYSVIQNSGHAYGDFVFTRLAGGSSPMIDATPIPPSDKERIPTDQPRANPEAHAVTAALNRYSQQGAVPPELREALSRLSAAYATELVPQVRKEWLGITKQQEGALKRVFSDLRAVAVEYDSCGTAEFSPTRDSATIVCTERLSYTHESQRESMAPLQVSLTLRSISGLWHVNSKSPVQ